jgi:hypothetical protein
MVLTQPLASFFRNRPPGRQRDALCSSKPQGNSSSNGGAHRHLLLRSMALWRKHAMNTTGKCRVAGCPKPLPPRNRVFCKEHSPEASAIWKKEHRATLAAGGFPYWLEDFLGRNGNDVEKARTEYNAYRRKGRRRRLARLRCCAAGLAAPDGLLSGPLGSDQRFGP